MLHLHDGDYLVSRRRTALRWLLKNQALLLPTKRFWKCTYSCVIYGIYTIQQCFVQLPSCSVLFTSWKGHWLQHQKTIIWLGTRNTFCGTWYLPH